VTAATFGAVTSSVPDLPEVNEKKTGAEAPVFAGMLEKLLPVQRPTRLIFRHARLEEVALLLQIDHPREGEDRYH
jgi:hypothetical protein